MSLGVILFHSLPFTRKKSCEFKDLTHPSSVTVSYILSMLYGNTHQSNITSFGLISSTWIVFLDILSLSFIWNPQDLWDIIFQGLYWTLISAITLLILKGLYLLFPYHTPFHIFLRLIIINIFSYFGFVYLLSLFSLLLKRKSDPPQS